MITKENLCYVFENLNEEEIAEAFESGKDYIKITLSVFDSGAVPKIEAVDYSLDDEIWTQGMGNIYCDFETLRTLFYKSGCTNIYLMERF